MNFKFSCFLLLMGMAFLGCQSQQPIAQNQPEVQENITERQDDVMSPKQIKELEAQKINYRATPERKFDLLHSSLALQFDYEKKLVMGKAELTVRPFFYPQRRLVLDAKDFDIHEVGFMKDGQVEELDFDYNSRKLEIDLGQSYNRADTLRIFISYTAHPERNSGEGSKAITDNKGLYFIDYLDKGKEATQLWTQGETAHNSKWFPTIDTPNERATHDLLLTVQEKYTTISNGKLLSKTSHDDGTRTDHWQMDQPHAPYLVAFAAGDFVRVADEWEGVPLGYYVEPAFESAARKVFGKTPKMMGFYSKLLGVDYPWGKYDQVVVRDFVSGAMENTTVSIFMEALNMDEREAIDSEFDGIIAHELFHHWFGDYVTTESWSNLPLNEAFANYGEYLWYEYQEGKDAADLHHIGEMEAYFWEAEEKKVDLIRFEYEDPEEMFDSHSYAKGGRVLHMLRGVLGDDAFFGGLNLYLERNAYKSVEIHDLRLAMEEVSGRDLNWFFDQWFLASGHPELKVRFDYGQPENVRLKVIQLQDLKNTPLYRIPFEVSWYVEGRRFSKEFVLENKEQTFDLENGVPITLAYFDEEKRILALLETDRSVEQFKEQFETSQLGVARYEALDSLSGEGLPIRDMRGLVEKGLKDPFWPIREQTIRYFGDHLKELGVGISLMDVASSDPSNSVRASAIEQLAGLQMDGVTDKLLLWMEDSSYYVAGAALGGYLESAGEDLMKRQVALAFDSESSIRMVVPLVDYYTREQISGKGDWLQEKLAQMSGQDLYYLIGYYADYFVRMPSEGSEAAIEELYRLGKEGKDAYVRLAAFQALFGFIDEPGVVAKVTDIWKQEPDEEVKKNEEYFILPYMDEN